MAIERDLHDLLHCHDCVIVPQWGGFLTHYRSARLDQARSVVHPPGKDLSFNRQLSRNDGLLADHLSKRTGIAFDAATTRIDEEVAGWRSTLERHGRLELPHIGIFYHDADHNLQFDPDRRTNYLKDAYGLRPVTAVVVHRASPRRDVITMPPPVIVPKRMTPVTDEEAAMGSGRRTPVLWAAAIVTAVLFSAAAFWLVQQDAMEDLQWSSLDPFNKPAQRTYVPTLPQEEPSVSTAGIFSLPEDLLGVRELPLTTNDSVTLIVDLEAPVTPVLVPDSVAVHHSIKAETAVVRARFHVVGGCFAEPANADRFLDELIGKGHPAVQLDLHKGLHPVAFGSYATRRDALNALEAIRTQGAGSAWLLVR